MWYFGDHAGLDFRNGEPVALTDGALNTEEGSASICDNEGNLLFYTDGVTVYNRLHQIMPNGRNLWGSYTTTQTLIVPQPGNDAIYYVFTASPQYDYIFGPGTDSVGLHYSVVDMSLEGGFGNISDKNILLFKNTTEKITAVHHANGKDIWVVTHEWESNKFRSYLVTETAILAEPVISEVGIVHSGDGTSQGTKGNNLGQMKLSPNGEKIALAIYEQGVFVYDFNNSSGKVSNQAIAKQNPNVLFYGIEFSPNNKLLYFTDVFIRGCNTESENSILYQFSITDKKAIEVGRFIGLLGGLQLALDGKIYAIECNELSGMSLSTGVIEFPNRHGMACGFTENRLSLITGKGRLGTPNFIQSYFLFPNPILIIPNVFTPNTDEYNPVIKPIQFDNILEADLKIFNRWGQEIFYTKEISFGWDGGQNPSGVYYWIVQYEGKNGKNGTQKGWVQLIR
jgi:gliding motility-associated-like protein